MVAILTYFNNGRTLFIGENYMSRVNPALLGRAVAGLKVLDVQDT